MATRNPVTIFLGTLTTAATGMEYTVPANAVLTISAATANNTTAAGVAMTVQVTPSGGAALPFVSGQVIPNAGNPPTTIPGLVGQSFPAGAKLQALADSGSAVNVLVSGYLQQ